MIMSDAAPAADQGNPGELKGREPELSLNEIAALLRGKLPPSIEVPCLDQLPFIPVRNEASAS